MSAASGFAAKGMLQGVAKVAGPVIGFTADLAEGKSVGQAIAHTAATTAVSAGLTLGLQTTLLAFGLSNPVGWAAIGTAVGIGFISNIIYDSNIMGIQQISKDWASNFDNGVKNIKKGIDGVGQSISKGLSNLTSGFGW